MSETKPRPGLPPRVILALVVALFVLPILIAGWMARHQAGLGQHLVNHGIFIRPPLDIAADPDVAALRAVTLDPGEWAVVYFTSGACDVGCTAAVATLLTLKSLLGNAATRVRIVRVTDAAAAAEHGLIAIADARARRRLSALATSPDDPQASDRGVVFLDWRGQIMMRFADTAAPADIKSDLKRLLRASKIK